MQRYNLTEICSVIEDDYVLHGDAADVYVEKITTPHNADAQSLVFINTGRQDKHELLAMTQARIIICDASIPCEHRKKNQVLIVVKDPKYVFATIGNHFFTPKPTYSIHTSAIIHPDAVIAKNVHIGPHTYIGKCIIKENTVIHGHCYLYDNVEIHQNVIIQAGCMIGADGCGQIKNHEGRYIPFPHIGGVVIEADVEIGTNTAIAKGALGNTRIKKGCVIDSFVQVGHNVLIEENVLVLANSVIGGSSVIKQDAVLAIGAHICDYVTVGEGVHVGPNVVIMNDVPAGSKVMPRSPLTIPRDAWTKNKLEQEATLC